MILPKSGKILLTVSCLTIWSDAFPVNAPNQFLMQGVKVEVCDQWDGLHVEVSERVYQELANGDEYVLSDWKVIKRHALKESAPERETQ